MRTLLLLIALLCLSSCASAPRKISANHKFVLVKRVNVYTDRAFAVIDGVPKTEANVTLAHPEELGSFNKLSAFIGMGRLNMLIPNRRVEVFAKIASLTTSYMIFQVNSDLGHYISKLSFEILFIKDEYSSTSNINMYSGIMNYPAKKYISDGKSAVGRITLDEKNINITGGVRIYYAVTGVNTTSLTSRNVFDVNVQMYVKITDVISVYCDISSYIKE